MNTKLVLEPAANTFLPSAGSEFPPIIVNFILGRALDHKRNGLIEAEVVFLSAIHGRELLVLKREGGMLDCSFFVRFLPFPITVNVADFSKMEYRLIKADCFSALPHCSPTNMSVGVIFGVIHGLPWASSARKDHICPASTRIFR